MSRRGDRLLGGLDGVGDEGAHLSENYRARIRRRAGDACERCGASEPLPGENAHGVPFLQFHHQQRIADGGIDSDENLVLVCVACHREWHAVGWRYLTPDEWMRTPPYRELICLPSEFARGFDSSGFD